MENIKFDDWQKLDLRTAKIIDVEEIEGADNLYKILVDLGNEKRTLVAGLKPYYKKEELKGKTCIVFTNLEPKTLKGVESQGMILAATSEDESQVRLLQPDEEIKEGSLVR